MTYDIPYLLNNALMDSTFPYPMAFCTCYNLAIMGLCVGIAIIILFIISIVSRTFSKFLGH